MAMIRVPPGTIPREPPRDSLKQMFDIQRGYMNLKQQGDLNSAMSGRTGQFSRPLVGGDIPDPESIKGGINAQGISDRSSNLPDFTGPRPSGFWGRNSAWNELNSFQKAAAMALLEADSSGGRPNFNDAKNAMGAMINRADKEGQDLGDHVSRKIYQPTIEPAQYARLQSVTRSPEFQALTGLAEARESGQVGDWVDGATHFLAKPSVMLKLEAEDPQKYRSWRGWTGYDSETGRYKNEVMSDSSHVFLAPEGKHSAGQPLVDPQNPTQDPTLGPPTDAAPYIPTPSPIESAGGSPPPSLPKLAELFGLPTRGRLPQGGNPLEDLQSKPISLQGLEGSPDQEQASFAMLPSQHMRTPGGGQPTLPTPRRLPGFDSPW